ncbi:PST2 Protoplast secreted protein 2 [Candida maltosa Xu316]|uniref:Flavodoxin-like reductase, putative n=1 Tax=Candida maltosa (strain Xu316) TaxID=1245528 RepID=M3J537_CANMX|nr:Flavodoxin-like reductase, putative [Candida maltosa Xu316]
MAKVAIIIYSLYHHVYDLALAEKEGIEAAGGQADIYQVKETLSDEVLTKMHAPTKPDLPVATWETFTQYDAFLLGVPTRFGNFPAQWKTLIDRLGGLWAKKALRGKYAGVFVSTGTLGGGQEATIINTLSTLAHNGIVFVPFGYGHDGISNLDEVHGGSPWGAGTLAGPDSKRKVTDLEKAIAKQQGHDFYQTVYINRFSA